MSNDNSIEGITTDLAGVMRQGLFPGALAAYLQAPDEEKKTVLVALGHEADDLQLRYFGRHTTLSERIVQKVDSLAAGDQKEWALLLNSSQKESAEFGFLLSLSPWSTSAACIAAYGKGFQRDEASMYRLFRRIFTAKGLPSGDCQRYLLVFPPDLLEQIITRTEVIDITPETCLL